MQQRNAKPSLDTQLRLKISEELILTEGTRGEVDQASWGCLLLTCWKRAQRLPNVFRHIGHCTAMAHSRKERAFLPRDATTTTPRTAMQLRESEKNASSMHFDAWKTSVEAYNMIYIATC